jgi:hypothetical protein
MAFPATYNFNYYRGDSYSFSITPKNANGTTFDLTGYSASFNIATARGSSGVFVTDGSATVDAGNGRVDCAITPTVGVELGLTTYYYDVEITKLGKVYTVVTGTINVTQDVTGAGA